MAKNSRVADQVKQESVRSPVQKVRPVKTTGNHKDELQQLNVWIPKELIKRLKVKGLNTDKSLKAMTIEAITQYL